jgi:hypothetical protein
MFGALKRQQASRRPARPEPLRSAQRSRFALLLLCAALLFVQTLGQLHRATHGAAHGSLSQTIVSQASVSLADKQSQSLNASAAMPGGEQSVLGLFKDHQDLPKCQLFDGVGSAPALISAPVIAQIPAQGLIFSALYNVFVVERLTRHFQARAPPYA